MLKQYHFHLKFKLKLKLTLNAVYLRLSKLYYLNLNKSQESNSAKCGVYWYSNCFTEIFLYIEIFFLFTFQIRICRFWTFLKHWHKKCKRKGKNSYHGSWNVNLGNFSISNTCNSKSCMELSWSWRKVIDVHGFTCHLATKLHRHFNLSIQTYFILIMTEFL